MTFVNRLDSLLKSNNLTRKDFLTALKFGKNQITYWEKNNTLPNASTLSAIAGFFGVSVEYLTGVEDEEGLAYRITNLVAEWLMDNGFEYDEDEHGSVCICKDGEEVCLAFVDFVAECMAIKKLSDNGFDLAMRDWVRRNMVSVENSGNNMFNRSKNIISDSPNATLTVNDSDLSKQEHELIKMYREFSLEEQLDFISYALKLKNKEV